jgi:hypothetical protein
VESPADRFSTVSEFADALATMDIALRAIGPRHERKKSIAVLPFDCLGSNPDDSFWGDGLMEEVVAGTSKDVFELDDKLSHDIVQALNVTLTPEEHRISMAVCGPPSELSSVTPSAGSRMPSGEGSSTIHSCRARTCCSRTCAPIRASRR